MWASIKTRYMRTLLLRRISLAPSRQFFRDVIHHARATGQDGPVPALSFHLRQRILEAIPSAIRPERLIIWPYDRYPYGMGLDYERKFSYYTPGEPALPGNAPLLSEDSMEDGKKAICESCFMEPQACQIARQMHPSLPASSM